MTMWSFLMTDRLITMDDFKATEAADVTPVGALKDALKNSGDMKEVMVIGFNEEGGMFLYCSKMNRRDALWMLESAKLVALD